MVSFLYDKNNDNIKEGISKEVLFFDGNKEEMICQERRNNRCSRRKDRRNNEFVIDFSTFVHIISV